jgi:hypothetical protein
VIEYDTGPNVVGARSTAVRLPAANHARGVPNARSSPTGRPSRPILSLTSISRSVSRKAAFAPPFGGRYITRPHPPASEETLAASPLTNVLGVIAAASIPQRARASLSGRSTVARNREASRP